MWLKISYYVTKKFSLFENKEEREKIYHSCTQFEKFNGCYVVQYYDSEGAETDYYPIENVKEFTICRR